MPVLDQLASFTLLADLSETQLRNVAELASRTNFAAGAAIITEGRIASGCWLIRSGQVAIEVAVHNGRPAVVQTLGPGDVLGWSWLLSPYRWRFDARAATAVTAFELDAVRLRSLLANDPALGHAVGLRLIETLGDRLHATRARLMDVYGDGRVG